MSEYLKNSVDEDYDRMKNFKNNSSFMSDDFTKNDNQFTAQIYHEIINNDVQYNKNYISQKDSTIKEAKELSRKEQLTQKKQNLRGFEGLQQQKQMLLAQSNKLKKGKQDFDKYSFEEQSHFFIDMLASMLDGPQEDGHYLFYDHNEEEEEEFEQNQDISYSYNNQDQIIQGAQKSFGNQGIRQFNDDEDDFDVQHINKNFSYDNTIIFSEIKNKENDAHGPDETKTNQVSSQQPINQMTQIFAINKQIKNTQSNLNKGRWSKDEHNRFLEALKQYGKDWKMIQIYVQTRPVENIRAHAQKFMDKLVKIFANPDDLKSEKRKVNDNEVYWKILNEPMHKTYSRQVKNEEKAKLEENMGKDDLEIQVNKSNSSKQASQGSQEEIVLKQIFKVITSKVRDDFNNNIKVQGKNEGVENIKQFSASDQPVVFSNFAKIEEQSRALDEWMQEKKKVQVLQLSAWVPLKSLQSKQESYGSQGSQEINPFNRMKSTSTVSGNKIKNNLFQQIYNKEENLSGSLVSSNNSMQDGARSFRSEHADEIRRIDNRMVEQQMQRLNKEEKLFDHFYKEKQIQQNTILQNQQVNQNEQINKFYPDNDIEMM